MTHPTNALAKASSSLLRSAMHQPVEWHGGERKYEDEALARALVGCVITISLPGTHARDEPG